jgi:hypothetical protein
VPEITVHSKQKPGSAALESAIEINGVLKGENGRSYLIDDQGTRHFEDEIIWDGYLTHWQDQPLNARLLPQKDYQTDRPILFLWPVNETPFKALPYIEIYYGERLVNYRGSLFGHAAINVDGQVFNFSYRINENERISKEEYFYRPALGPFAPHPVSGTHHDALEEQGERAYYDNYGRVFMRTVHVLRLEGPSLDTQRLLHLMNQELDAVLTAPRDPVAPNIYKDFHFFRRNCTTILRDGLRDIGFHKITGIAPRDFFINAAFFFLKNRHRLEIDVKLYRYKQLKVLEAPYSKITPLINPMNILKKKAIGTY